MEMPELVAFIRFNCEDTGVRTLVSTNAKSEESGFGNVIPHS